MVWFRFGWFRLVWFRLIWFSFGFVLVGFVSFGFVSFSLVSQSTVSLEITEDQKLIFLSLILQRTQSELAHFFFDIFVACN